MATVTINDGPVTIGSEFKVVATLALDSSYPTGGEAVSARQLGLSAVTTAQCDITAVGGSINVANASYDKTNGKVLLYDETPAQVANAANVDGTKVQIIAYGKTRV